MAFTVPAERTEAVAGRALIRFALATAAEPLILDYQPDRAGILRAVEANGVKTTVRQVNGHIIVPAEALREGENSLELDFNAGDVPLNRNDEFLYTIFVPARAHLAFPCFDQPDLKHAGRWRWMCPWAGRRSATAPRSTGRRRAAARGCGSRARSRSRLTCCVCRRQFNLETRAQRADVPHVPPRDRCREVARNREAIFDLHAGALVVARELHRECPPVPVGSSISCRAGVQFGGMEHPGAIFTTRTAAARQSATQTDARPRQRHRARDGAHGFGDW